MASYVPIPKDLTKIKNKPIFNLSVRQLVCFGSAAAVGVPIYFLTKGVIGNSAAVFLMIGLMLPFFFLAMFERDGQPAEKILRNFARSKLWPSKRPYKTENLYKYLQKEGDAFEREKENQSTAHAGKVGGRGRKSGKHGSKGRKTICRSKTRKPR